ncbi:MAG TPA: DUF6088 family protein [Cyclobacteriaceae bacterium]|nr:DUF6088 family protein [Cyclobacteriaceae bacterium]
MDRKSTSVKDKIANRIRQLLPGSILFAQDFADEGTNESIRQQLVQLARQGTLIRLSQGIYLLPKRIGNEHFIPSAEEIVNAIARRDKSRIIPSGEVALWKLGLSTQVPLNHVYLTDGPSRSIKIEEKGKRTSYTINLKHASPKNFALRGKISASLVQALKTIGEKNLSPEIVDKIQALVMRENLDDLKHDLTVAPAWIAKLIRESFNRYKYEGLDTPQRTRQD